MLETFGLSMELHATCTTNATDIVATVNDDILVYMYRPLPCKLLLALSELNVSCFTKYR